MTEEKVKRMTKVARFEITGMCGEEKKLMNFILKELRYDS